MDKYAAQLPQNTKVEVSGIEDSDLQGFKKGSYDVELAGRGKQSIPFLISKSGRYLVLGNNTPINFDDFEDTPVKGIKKGVINIGRPVPVLLTEDGKSLLVGDLVDITVDPFKEISDKISLDDSPVKGNSNAKVTVVEYSDFQCPYCRRGSEMIPQIISDYGDKVKVVYKQMPLANHNWAKAASVASICSYKQGNDKFWSFHDTLFSKQREIKLETSEQQFRDIAKEVGLDMASYNKCLNSKDVADKVQADIKEAELIGVNSTPTFVINGVIVPGANLQAVKNAIDSRLPQEG